MGNTTVSPTHEQLFGGGATSSNARFVDPASIPMDEVRERLKQQCAYKPSLEINFVMSRDSKIACFWGKQFYITDDSFTPELVYETESFVNAASISDGSRYAVCQTAHNARNDEDSGTFAVIDVPHKKVLGKYRTKHGWKYMTHLYVDEREKCFWAYFGDDKEKVSFADRVKEEPTPEQKPTQSKKENPAAEPGKKQNKKANVIAIVVAVFFAFMLFGGFDLIVPRKRTTSTTRVSTPETNRSVLEETTLNALDKESAAYISSIDAFYYSSKYTLTIRTVSSGGLYLPIVAEQTAQAVFDKAAELGITLSEYKVEEFSEGNSSKVENLILWKSTDGVTGTYTDDSGSSPYIETDVTIERLAEIVK